MGKDLHYSILPFIKTALTGHKNVSQLIPINDPDFFIFRIIRIDKFDNVILIISDDYNFGEYNHFLKHPTLKNGGFILIAKPEANNDYNEPENKLGIGKLGKLLGALNKNDFYNYEIPIKKTNT